MIRRPPRSTLSSSSAASDVYKRQVYVMNTPMAKYEIVVRMNTFSLANINVSTIATGGVIRETAADKVNKYVNQILRQAEKDSVHVDAIIYSGGKGAVGIAYTGEENRGMAEVKQMYGMDLYAFCEPVNSYDMVNSKRARSGSVVAGSTYGVIDSSIDEDIEKLSLIHISEPTRLLSISYAVFCLKKKKKIYIIITT
eukprot:TRINITY_DN18133_c0_g1_i1.p1 TRINITY_DN18133_c0_g1~~TRINITY_DN18133_c0_g1_i1.p1  ORF type:complete len:197 (+),score=15.79 TRINITY_DN18133_c0_g1_i1:143-733(+)